MSLIALMHLCIRNVNVYVWLDSIQTRIRACMRRVAVLGDSMVPMQKMRLGDFSRSLTRACGGFLPTVEGGSAKGWADEFALDAA
jgi:hypothetical protein